MYIVEPTRTTDLPSFNQTWHLEISLTRHFFPGNASHGADDQEQQGLVPRVAEGIFRLLRSKGEVWTGLDGWEDHPATILMRKNHGENGGFHQARWGFH